MAISRSTNANLLWPGILRTFGLVYNQQPEQYTQIFEDIRSTKAYEEYQENAGFGYVPEKTEGADISYFESLQGFSKTITNLSYGMGFRVTREALDDELYGQIRLLPKHLAYSAKETVEILGANVLNNAFDSSYPTADGLELCSAVHKLPGQSTTASNELDTPADLSDAALEQALIDIADFVGPDGKKIAVRPRKLVVPKELDYTASKILESTLEPETANNAINPAKGRMPYVVNEYLTDPDAWFILTDVEGLVCQKRAFPPMIEMDNDFNSKDMKASVYFRIAFGAYDWRSIFGTPGGA